MRVNADSLIIRAATTSTSGTLNDLTTDLTMANNNSYNLIKCLFIDVYGASCCLWMKWNVVVAESTAKYSVWRLISCFSPLFKKCWSH